MNTATRVGAVATALALGAYALMTYDFSPGTQTKHLEERPAGFSCWWTPRAEATVRWGFGNQKERSTVLSVATPREPITRESKLKIGETLRLLITFTPGQPTTGAGMKTFCTMWAGATRRTVDEDNHKLISRTIFTT